MSVKDTIKGEVEMGLRLIAWQGLDVEVAPMAVVDEALKENGWSSVSAVAQDGRIFRQVWYGTATKTYVNVTCDGYSGACRIESAEESDVLEGLTFAELQHLSDLIDKKSVAFIRIYREKELSSASTEEELKALNERNEKWIAEAEVALRKR